MGQINSTKRVRILFFVFGAATAFIRLDTFIEITHIEKDLNSCVCSKNYTHSSVTIKTEHLYNLEQSHVCPDIVNKIEIITSTALQVGR